MCEVDFKEEKKQIYPVLFELGLKDLIKSKSNLLFELRELELDLINSKHDLASIERSILLTTDFKDLGLTNEKMRIAYINEQLEEENVLLDIKKTTIASKKDTLEIINDLIKLQLEGE